MKSDIKRVLFVGGGRRVSLAKRFIAEGFDVISYETDKNAPISTVATIVEGKKWSERGVSEHLLETFQKCSIDLAIPLQDHATDRLSYMIEEAAEVGTKLPVPHPTASAKCLNKQLFEDACQRQFKFDFYPSVSEECEKVILKPTFGFNSKGIRIISKSEYDQYNKIHNGDFVAQRYIGGGYEISVDAYFNKQGKMVDAVPRRRLEIQGGEVSKSITLARDAFGVVEITRTVGEKFGLMGPTCFQYVIDGNKPYIMECNARFGGGVILSLEAGLNMVKLLRQEYIDGLECPPMEYPWKVNFGMTRYFSECFYG
jgi:carbamoyl-phosphate synthase large subunit